MNRVIAGIGFRAGCPAGDIVDLVLLACARAERTANALAAPDFKIADAGIRTAATRLGLPLLAVDAAGLAAAQPRCVTHSKAALAAIGVASVAEGSALAAAGVGARLILPRIATGRATCALAEAAA